MRSFVVVDALPSSTALEQACKMEAKTEAKLEERRKRSDCAAFCAFSAGSFLVVQGDSRAEAD